MIASIDHVVLTVRDVHASVRFYEALGLRRVEFDDGRIALQVGDQKLNLHPFPSRIRPRAASPTPGSLDLCFLLDCSLAEAGAELVAAGIPVELGPVPRTGARGPIDSLYVRDPDDNLIELAVPRKEAYH